MTAAGYFRAVADFVFDPDRELVCDNHDEYCRGAPAWDLYGITWPTCPFDALCGSAWSAVVRTDDVASVAPLSGWPDTYAPWLVDGVIALRRAREASHAEAAARRAKRGR